MSNNIDFSLHIERYALEHRLDLSDAILQIMDEKDLDENKVAANITDGLKQKLKLEYEKKKLLL